MDWRVTTFDDIGSSRKKVIVKHVPSNTYAWDWCPEEPKYTYIRRRKPGILGWLGFTKVIRLPEAADVEEVMQNDYDKIVKKLRDTIEESLLTTEE